MKKVKQWLTIARDGPHTLAANLLTENPELITAVDEKYQMTALHWATAHGNLEMVKLLLKVSADLAKAADCKGMTALHWAASNRERALAMPLLLAVNPASLQALDSKRQTPLDTAMLSRDVAVTAQFFAADPSLVHRTIDSRRRTVLHMAVDCDSPEIVEQILTINPQLTKVVNSHKKTAFDGAIKKDCLEVLARFLVHDISLCGKVPLLHGGTALHCASECGYVEGVTKLLAQHPDMIDALDDWGMTALHVAAMNGHSEVVTRLLAVASPQMINVVSKNGHAALHCAACTQRAHVAIVNQLLDVTSPDLISAMDSQGKTVLYWAAHKGEAKTVARLLAMSPGLIDQVTSKGETVLHTSVSHDVVAEMLLTVRPEMVHAVDNDGNTILHSAVGPPCASQELIERLLVLNPAAVLAVNSKGQTPFALAVRSLSRLGHIQPTVNALMAKLSLDEAVGVFTKCKTKHYEEEFLVPMVERQCECLRDVLNRDVMGVVYEHLGLDSTLMTHNTFLF